METPKDKADKQVFINNYLIINSTFLITNCQTLTLISRLTTGTNLLSDVGMVYASSESVVYYNHPEIPLIH